MKAYLSLIRFNKPIGTLLLLWPSLVSLVLAEGGIPDLWLSFCFCLAVFLARSMGCIINDIADHKIDLHVKRTSQRVLTSGKISLWQAWITFIIFGLVLFALSFVFNALTVKLSFIALFLMMIYPFSKRFFAIPQLFLGLAYGFASVMAFAVIDNQINPMSFSIYAFAIVWTLYYDTLYALVDLDDDIKLNIKTSALFFGKLVFQAILMMQIVLILGWLILGYLFKLNLIYFLGLIFGFGYLYYQHRLIKKNKREDFFKAFLNNNYFGLIWFVSVLAGIN